MALMSGMVGLRHLNTNWWNMFGRFAQTCFLFYIIKKDFKICKKYWQLLVQQRLERLV